MFEKMLGDLHFEPGTVAAGWQEYQRTDGHGENATDLRQPSIIAAQQRQRLRRQYHNTKIATDYDQRKRLERSRARKIETRRIAWTRRQRKSGGYDRHNQPAQRNKFAGHLSGEPCDRKEIEIIPPDNRECGHRQAQRRLLRACRHGIKVMDQYQRADGE